MQPVTSSTNRYLKLYRRLALRSERRESNLLPLEGSQLVKEAVKFDLGIEAVFVREGQREQDFSCLRSLDDSVPIMQVEGALFDRASHTGVPQGIMALVKRPSHSLEDLFAKKPALLLIADQVQDPVDLGTMICSAAACGASGVALLPGTVDATNPKALHATKGTFFRLPIVETGFTALHDALRSHGLSLLAASGGHCYPYIRVNWRQPVAVVVCNENTGLTTVVKAACDAVVSIPMAAGVESLNAVESMAVIFFEAARQRHDHNYLGDSD